VVVIFTVPGVIPCAHAQFCAEYDFWTAALSCLDVVCEMVLWPCGWASEEKKCLHEMWISIAKRKNQQKKTLTIAKISDLDCYYPLGLITSNWMFCP
jgi:hypothetical protein